MAEPLKNMYNVDFLRAFGAVVQAEYPPLSIDSFIGQVIDDMWEELSLKERMRKITISLGEHLPSEYKEAITILIAVNKSCVGFPYLILPDFVEVYGQAEQDWDYSMEALEQFTAHSTAEFAIRSFIINNPERTMKQMMKWTLSPNEHVRRLSSEGCRPRLPWGQALHMFKKDPAPILNILEHLKADASLYVRKSVANNLNDISKDHPDIVIQIARKWLGHNRDTDWIVRHSCRTLIRQANPVVLELFGYTKTSQQNKLIEAVDFAVNKESLQIGDECQLSYELLVRKGDAVRIRIEYGIDFVKSSGKTSTKKFLLSDKTVEGGTKLKASRTHRWADLTTRRHYPGKHRISLIVNGVEIAETKLLLELNN